MTFQNKLALAIARTRCDAGTSLKLSDMNGNLNAPTIMAAEKVADHILGRALPPDHAAAAATWVDPEWRTRQRERPPMRRVWDGQF